MRQNSSRPNHWARRTSALLLLAFTAASIRPAARAAEDDESSQSRPQPAIVARANTSSPRATLSSFLQACNEAYDTVRETGYIDRDNPVHRATARRIVDCLDLSELPEFTRIDRGIEAAVCLKEILDRVEIPPADEIPGPDALVSPGGREEFSQWRIPGTRITIARIEEGPQRHEYLFTSDAVEFSVEYFRDVQHLPYRTDGPRVSPQLYRWYLSAPRGPHDGDLGQ